MVRQILHEDIGVVIIGRNEGPRLRRCIESIAHHGHQGKVVYVDSGSSDGSVNVACELGIDVVELSPAKPFSAARGRNEGAEALRRQSDTVAAVQFVDGDCELDPGWIMRARDELLQRSDVAVVCGMLRERDPDASIYNRLSEMEWNGPAGEISACGGIAMMRMHAFEEVGGFREDMMAGEEPELCARLREGGWKIVRIAAEMGVHDADMTQFRQWWRRAVRSGHAWAERAWLHGMNSDRMSVRQVASILLWSVVLPVIMLSAAWPTRGLSLLLALVYPLQWLRMCYARTRAGHPLKHAALDACFTILGKFAEALGVFRFIRSRLLPGSRSASSARAGRAASVAPSSAGDRA